MKFLKLILVLCLLSGCYDSYLQDKEASENNEEVSIMAQKYFTIGAISEVANIAEFNGNKFKLSKTIGHALTNSGTPSVTAGSFSLNTFNISGKKIKIKNISITQSCKIGATFSDGTIFYLDDNGDNCAIYLIPYLDVALFTGMTTNQPFTSATYPVINVDPLTYLSPFNNITGGNGYASDTTNYDKDFDLLYDTNNNTSKFGMLMYLSHPNLANSYTDQVTFATAWNPLTLSNIVYNIYTTVTIQGEILE